MGTSRWTLLRSVYSFNFWECPEGKSSTFPQFRHQSHVFSFSSGLLDSCLYVSVQFTQWQHLKGNSFQPCTEETDSPLPIITAHRGWQDHKRKGEEQSKANEEGNTCDISYKGVIEILLAKRGVLEEPADKWKYFLSIFLPFSFRASGFASLPLCLLIGSLSL